MNGVYSSHCTPRAAGATLIEYLNLRFRLWQTDQPFLYVFCLFGLVRLRPRQTQGLEGLCAGMIKIIALNKAPFFRHGVYNSHLRKRTSPGSGGKHMNTLCAGKRENKTNNA